MIGDYLVAHPGAVSKYNVVKAFELGDLGRSVGVRFSGNFDHANFGVNLPMEKRSWGIFIAQYHKPLHLVI